jgi:hypothetical protein
MTEKKILKTYISWVRKALERDIYEDPTNWPEDLMDDGFSEIFNEFYKTNYTQYHFLFEKIGDYFSSLDQGFQANLFKGKNIYDFKFELIDYLDYFTQKEKL